MDQKQAREELAAIRSVMKQTQQAVYQRGGGWITAMWGGIWFVGFCGNQFLSEEAAGCLWIGLNILGFVSSTIVLLRHRERVSSPLWRRIGLSWVALIAFVALLWFLLELNIRQGSLLIILTLGLVYLLVGLFSHSSMVLVGLALVGTATAAYLLIPDFFFLTVALLLGGGLTLFGLWPLLRRGR